MEIKAEDIDQMIANAIIESSIGKHVKAEVAKAVKSIDSGFFRDNWVQRMIEKEVEVVVRELIQDKYSAQLRDSVEKHLDANIDELVDEAARKVTINRF